MLELKFLLENVGDSYPDFVSGVLVSTKGNNAKREQVADFIDGDPGVTSSEIIEYLDTLEEKEKELFCLIDGIPGMYDDLKNVVLRYARRNAGGGAEVRRIQDFKKSRLKRTMEKYYSELQKMDFFKIHPYLIPFVGKDYEKYRILHIGESHYLNQQRENIRVQVGDFLDEWWEKPCEKCVAGCESSVDTRDVIRRYVNDESRETIFENVLRSFSGVVLSEEIPHVTGTEKGKYNYFAFMNYYQMPSLLSGVKFWDSLVADDKSMASEMWHQCVRESDKIVDGVIDILEPRMVVITSVSAGDAYSGKYRESPIMVYTSHPQAPYSWKRKLKQIQISTACRQQSRHVTENSTCLHRLCPDVIIWLIKHVEVAWMESYILNDEKYSFKSLEIVKLEGRIL